MAVWKSESLIIKSLKTFSFQFMHVTVGLYSKKIKANITYTCIDSYITLLLLFSRYMCLQRCSDRNKIEMVSNTGTYIQKCLLVDVLCIKGLSTLKLSVQTYHIYHSGFCLKSYWPG